MAVMAQMVPRRGRAAATVGTPGRLATVATEEMVLSVAPTPTGWAAPAVQAVQAVTEARFRVTAAWAATEGRAGSVAMAPPRSRESSVPRAISEVPEARAVPEGMHQRAA